MKIFSSFFKQNFSWYRLKTPQIRQDENWNFCKYAPLEVCWEKISPGRADDVRTELLKLQITSPGCESWVRGLVTCQGWIVMAMVSCVWIWITIQSLWTVECPHTSLHTQAQSPWSPSVLWTSDICILTFCILQCSVPQLLQSVYDRSQIYSRAPGPAGQWSVCSMWSPVANNVRALSSWHS